MLKEEIKYEINNVLDHFSDDALKELLMFLQGLDSIQALQVSFTFTLKQILAEDFELLSRLAQ